MCREWFALEGEATGVLPEEAVRDELLERLLRDGTFGADERLVAADVRKEWRRCQKSGHFARVWRTLFPTAAHMKVRYPYAARCGWLLPAAYVHRFWQGVTVNRDVHRKRLSYAKEHQNGLEREVAFFERIGL